ncbi:MAG TPA: HD domain-containing protein [Candidatus Avacidaminococcus intestinavium]|uniref:HD domain-containing protein n=1 Tax=Candidatus Avacidaminococcus intestinavium TaxID=2840684 RepID=A0A9D1MQ24_9FIRM|nr:HD domain-containing protein [Candidatus Avacidaminococcus intestinavium]
MKRKKLKTLALIHIGSEMISLQIAEYRDLDKIKVLEEASHKVRLGEETFKNKRISLATANEVCELLKGFRRLCTDYGVEEYCVQATTAVREAENQLYFLDQIFVKTGLIVDVVDMPREIYTKYASIQRSLHKAEIGTGSGVLLVDISSGGLGITYVRDRKIKYQQNLHIGIIRIKEDFGRTQKSSMHFSKALTEYIASTVGPVREALEKEEVNYFVLSGAETELVLKMLGRNSDKDLVERIPADDFITFYDKIRSMNLTQIIKIFAIEETSAEIIFPTIVLYQQLLALVPAKEVIVMPNRFIDGMRLMHIANNDNTAYVSFLQGELLSLVHCIGERYKYDYKHVRQVEVLALAMFDKLSKKHGLDEHIRFLLRAACILHDIGKYICLRSHALYSYQLIMASDMLGFSDHDKKIIALAAYYHSHVLFDHQNEENPKVERSDIPLVAKLSAILRLADALDRSYQQKIEQCKVVAKGNELLFQAFSRKDLTLEEWTFNNKKNFFIEVFGLVPILERVGGTNNYD